MQDVPERHEPVKYHPQRLRAFSRGFKALLHASASASPQDIPVLLQELSKLLHGVFEFDFISYSLAGPDSGAMPQYLFDKNGIGLPGYPLELETKISAAGWVWANQSPLIFADLNVEERFFSNLAPYRDKGVRSLVLLPLSSQDQQLGAIGFAKTELAHYDDATVHFLMQVAGLVALAVSHVLDQQGLAGEEEKLRALTAISIQLSQRSAQAHHTLREERARLEAVLEINAALGATKLDIKPVFPAISKSLSGAIPHDIAVMNLWNEQRQGYQVFSKESSEGSEFVPVGLMLPSESAFTTYVLEKFPDGTVVRKAELQEAAGHFEVVRDSLNAGIVCWCMVPMRSVNRLVGVLYLGSRSEDVFTDKDVELVRQVAAALAVFLESALIHETLQHEKENLQRFITISRLLSPSLDYKKLLAEIANCARAVFGEANAYLSLYDPSAWLMRTVPLDPSRAERSTATESSALPENVPPALLCAKGRFDYSAPRSCSGLLLPSANNFASSKCARCAVSR